MKPYRYIKLSPCDLLALEEGHKNGLQSHFRIRCHSILLSHRGMKVSEICVLYNKDDNTIRTWMDNWEKKGVAGLLIAKGRGRKPTLDPALEQTIELVKKKSRNNP